MAQDLGCHGCSLLVSRETGSSRGELGQTGVGDLGNEVLLHLRNEQPSSAAGSRAPHSAVAAADSESASCWALYAEGRSVEDWQEQAEAGIPPGHQTIS